MLYWYSLSRHRRLIKSHHSRQQSKLAYRRLSNIVWMKTKQLYFHIKLSNNIGMAQHALTYVCMYNKVLYMCNFIPQRPPVEWRNPPVAMAYKFPYILTWAESKRSIEVYSVIDQRCVQTIPFEVCTNTFVYVFVEFILHLFSLSS